MGGWNYSGKWKIDDRHGDTADTGDAYKEPLGPCKPQKARMPHPSVNEVGAEVS